MFDTTLPLFEKSLVDPESPALNEDGEFPEFDENVQYSVEYRGGLIPDKLVVSDIENFALWEEISDMQTSVLKMKQSGFGSPLRNVGPLQFWDFNPLDFGDIIDALSLRTVHPISYAANLVFDDTVDQKLEEALLYYSLTGIPYDRLFIDHSKVLTHSSTLDWLDIDLLFEAQADVDESSFGLGYDLLLAKNSPEY